MQQLAFEFGGSGNEVAQSGDVQPFPLAQRTLIVQRNLLQHAGMLWRERPDTGNPEWYVTLAVWENSLWEIPLYQVDDAFAAAVRQRSGAAMLTAEDVLGAWRNPPGRKIIELRPGISQPAPAPAPERKQRSGPCERCRGAGYLVDRPGPDDQWRQVKTRRCPECGGS